MSTTLETQVGGRTLTIETGKLARLAGGAVTIRYGDTMVLGTANRSDPRPGLDFFPLTVEFEERMYAAGKIPGGFIKREARASEAATLAARLTDRPIRPLFPEGYKDDIQLVITVLSTNQENEPDVIGTVAASAALTISEIPFNGPVGAVRIGRIDGEFVVNPTFSQLADSELDLIVSGTREAIMMVEAGAKLLPEDVMAEAILFGHRALQPLIDIQLELQKLVGKAKSTPFLEAGTGSVLDFAKAVEAGDEFVVVDVETTGTDPKMADLVEIAAVKVKDGKITDRWSTLVNPGRAIVGNQMHGIKDADVKKSPSPAEAAKQALKFIGKSKVVGHSVGFDLGFIEAALADGTHFESGSYLDTLTIAREGYPDLENYKLETLSRFFGIELAQAHRAGPDAEATANLLIWFGNDLTGRLKALREGLAASIRAARDGDSKAVAEAARREARVSKNLFSLVNKKVARQMALDEGIRMDGRGLTELRQISVDVGVLPRVHGSGLFTRGETQVLTVATLGTSSDVQRMDTISPRAEKKYIHHYNFPPYSTARTSRCGVRTVVTSVTATWPSGPSPRDPRFAHVPLHDPDRLATCSIQRVVVDGVDLRLLPRPDGRGCADPEAGRRRSPWDSSSRRKACRPLRHPRQEDSFGDMDFKVAGSREGITGFQMDLKRPGSTSTIIEKALEQARRGASRHPRQDDGHPRRAQGRAVDFAPRILTIKIHTDKIREIIGPGGKMIRKIQEESGASIDVEDDGTVEIASVDDENSRKAIHGSKGDRRGTGNRTRLRRHRPPGRSLRRVRRDPAGQGRPRPDR